MYYNQNGDNAKYLNGGIEMVTIENVENMSCGTNYIIIDYNDDSVRCGSLSQIGSRIEGIKLYIINPVMNCTQANELMSELMPYVDRASFAYHKHDEASLVAIEQSMQGIVSFQNERVLV